MNLLEILRIFGISARFCRTFGNFQEFKGILEILTDFEIFLGFLRDFLRIFANVYEDFQSNIPLEVNLFIYLFQIETGSVNCL